MNKGIPTAYAGQSFRSRLEARWAATFDLLNWQWTYEPFDGDGYVPDFLIRQGAIPLLAEIKPAVTSHQYREPIKKIITGIGELWRGHDAIVLGANIIASGTIAGIYIDWLNNQHDWHTSAAQWRRCAHCQNFAITTINHSRDTCAACGKPKPDDPTLNATILNNTWRAAGNLTQWQAA